MVHTASSRGRSTWAIIGTVMAVLATAHCVAPSPVVGSSAVSRPVVLAGVPAIPPDSVPAWLYADSSLTTEPGIADKFMRGVIMIRFQVTASQRDRQAAITAVHGVVVGGRRLSGQSGDGIYLIRLPSTSTSAELFAAIGVLNRMPQVRYALVNSVRTGG